MPQLIALSLVGLLLWLYFGKGGDGQDKDS